jgi:hypothetical protein
MSALVLVVEGMLSVGLLVCLGLFLQLKRELHQIRRSPRAAAGDVSVPSGASAAAAPAPALETTRQYGVAVRIPIDRLPQRTMPGRIGRVPARTDSWDDTPGAVAEEGTRLSGEEERLRHRVRELGFRPRQT